MKLHKLIEYIFTKPRVRRQLVMVYVAVLLIPVALCGFFLHQSQKSLRQHYKEQTEAENLRVKSILFDVTTSLYAISETIAYDSGLEPLLCGEYASVQEQKDAIDQYTTIDSIFGKNTAISSIDIYTLNETIGDYGNFHSVTPEIEEQDWYKRASESASVFWCSKSREDTYNNVYWELCLYRKIPLPRSKSYAVLVVAVSDNYLRNRIDNTSLDSVITVNEDPVFYSNVRSGQGKEMPVAIDYSLSQYTASGFAEIGGKKSMACVSTLIPLNTEDRIYLVSYNSDASADMNQILRNYILILGITILLPTMLFCLYSKYFSSRVQTLRKAMHQASRGNYDIIDSFTGSDELSETFQDLRVTIGEIQEKEAQIYRARIREQEIVNRQQQMEFRMLASQINPHFLYNTLETIRMKAFTVGDREVANAIKLLGKAMRYVLENTGTVSTPLAKELNYIRTYIAIQKLRFGERFDFREEIEPDLELDTYRILPLMLQPIVENAISHGLEGVETGGIITMEIFRRGERLCIFVKDNGSGMTLEELERLQIQINTKDDSRTRSIGLYNIQQRLKLCYGEACGLEVTSEKGKGTTVGMRLPLEQISEEVVK